MESSLTGNRGASGLRTPPPDSSLASIAPTATGEDAGSVSISPSAGFAAEAISAYARPVSRAVSVVPTIATRIVPHPDPSSLAPAPAPAPAPAVASASTNPHPLACSVAPAP